MSGASLWCGRLDPEDKQCQQAGGLRDVALWQNSKYTIDSDSE